MRILNKIGFEKMGFPYYGWLISIHTAIIRISLQLKYLIFYSEDGEVEYGGDTKYKIKHLRCRLSNITLFRRRL